MKLIRRSILALVLALSAIAPSCPRAVVYAQTIGGLGPGLGGPVNPFDPDYQQKLKIATITQQIDKANSDAAAAYLRVAQDWLTNAVMARDAGRAIPSIADPPLKVHVDPQTGALSNGPDAVASKPMLPAPSGGLVSGGIASNSPPPDRIDQMLAQQHFLYDLLNRMAADLNALKAKLGIQ